MAEQESNSIRGVQEWFRSADMEYINVVLQEDCAHRVLSQVGRMGAVQFTDLNADKTVFQRRYVNEVQRCDQVERKLRYLEEQLNRFNIPAIGSPSVDAFLDRLDQRQGTDNEVSRQQVNYMDNLENHVDEKESELVQLNMYNSTLSNDYFAQIELRHVLQQAKTYAQENVTDATFDAQSVEVSGSGDVEGGATYDNALRFRFISGVVTRENRNRFERMVFRSTRGNCLMRFYDIDDDTIKNVETGETLMKDVFIVFFQAPYIEQKIRRICDAFEARLYQIPDLSNVAAIEDRLREVHEDINDRQRVLQKNETDIKSLLSEVAQYLEVWKWIAMREKSIYHTMNHFADDVSGVLRGEGWVIATKREEVADMIARAHAESGTSNVMPSSVNAVPQSEWPSTPPTFFRTNKFTRVFQVIVDTYGVPRYHEANPALTTVITFPFFFGVMFGDIGHGLLLTIFALYIVFKEKDFEKLKGQNELGDMVFGGRYVIVLMGFFATYCGFIYNDWFAMGLRLWPSKWIVDETAHGDTIHFNPDPDWTYPLGVDPTWHRADNDLLFFNSLKMKMAVIFGVTHMMMGLFHRLLNALYFQDRGLLHNLDLWFEAVPMIIFMGALFGYMCFLILYKWSLGWLESDCGRDNCTNPPALLSTLINIALQPGNVPIEESLYSGQGTVQAILLLLAVINVPLMLIPKPYFLIKRMKNEHHHGDAHHGANGSSSGVQDSQAHLDEGNELMLGDDGHGDSTTLSPAAPPHGEEEEEHSAGDIWIHQAIETIEFTLGCISNTASYLRLWALSLAHSQLASVFLEKALLDYLPDDSAMGVILAFAGYAIFAAITFAVLMCMDNLECFLHSLRLAWVEFQNKFYKGDGVAFAPLDFRASLVAGLPVA
ncbi:V-type proton ATPase 116 kDa subunit a isoform 1 [Hondaea fermentalgiana]|uniref:V-type proton ATPase subunit a n=1 Tax=Hondaea fermentalgiana TaxID=2315210 RepID=A0A2R5GMA7_9STRA|nr:V-type proton ATPase 116 kDa subunit a isoform 1 [Hondaea fermentalgiana]|eukprot:GBG31765.1 V-type proton ATPase 116 kDa subunit a isoform 1 [Hondaea fermentalgiana]